MQYFVKIAKLFSILLLLALTLVIASTNMSSSIIVVANEAHTATTATTTYSSNSDPSSATITKIQSINNNPPSLPAAPPAIIHRNIRAPTAIGGPTLNDPTLKVEQMINTGLKRTTSMAFLGPNDILVLEKNTGKIHRILNGKILPQPLLDVNVANEAERGLLGIAVAKNDNASTENGNTRHVFLYYTESGGGKDGDDASNNTNTSTNTNATTKGIAPAGNRLYRYDLDLNNGNIKLTNPLLLLNLPASPPPGREGTEKNHNGGKVLIGPDNNVYVGIGDVAGHRGQAENNPNGIAPDGTSGIIRVTQVTQDGQFTNNPTLGTDAISLSLYQYMLLSLIMTIIKKCVGNNGDDGNSHSYTYIIVYFHT